MVIKKVNDDGSLLEAEDVMEEAFNKSP